MRGQSGQLITTLAYLRETFATYQLLPASAQGHEKKVLPESRKPPGAAPAAESVHAEDEDWHPCMLPPGDEGGEIWLITPFTQTNP